jgi:maltooligosyltrehalose trehalohydrolase
VWAPNAKKVELYLPEQNSQIIPMDKGPDNYWMCTVPGVAAGTKYFYRLNGNEDKPDPASRWQPDGVHAASAVVDPDFLWTDQHWSGVALQHYVLYELHVGTYTTEGTFEAIIPHLERLRDLGVTALELMPVAQFPGSRNWGYDGVYPFAPQHSYGGPTGLKKLVDAAHAAGIAVVLDVIYNHLGPEGNYFARYGPYFTDSYKTPWGDALNFDGAESGPVREFFLQNAEYWIREFHIDGLRLDAIHEIHDGSPLHILAEIQQRVTAAGEKLNRNTHIMAECDANDVRYLHPVSLGGYDLEAQWLDDFHHAVYTQLAGTDSSRYDPDYADICYLDKAFSEGFVYSGQYCPTRKKVHGTSSRDIAPGRFLVFMQNHDQVGNKLLGTRLAEEVSYEAVKLAAAATILSPYLPILFMGEELRETRPFMFFVDHSDEDLVEAVREGRRRDFMEADDTGEFPDPADIHTFKRCIINHARMDEPDNAIIWKTYQDLLTVRRCAPAVAPVARRDMRTQLLAEQKCLAMYRQTSEGASLLVLNFSQEKQEVELRREFECGRWGEKGGSASDGTVREDREYRLALDTASEKYRGPGSITPEMIALNAGARVVLQPESAVLYVVEW